MKVQIGKGLELNVDMARIEFNPAVHDHVRYIGLRNILMDAHATCTKAADGDQYVENSRAAAERKLEALYNGETRATNGQRREADPIKVEANRIATQQAKKLLKEKDKETDAKTVRQLAVQLIEKNAWIMKKAKKNVDDAAKVEIDTSGIEI